MKEPRTSLTIRGHPDPATVSVGFTGVRIESGVDAINCTVYLSHEKATKMAEFIIVEQALRDVSIPRRKRGRHEVRELR